MKERNKFVIDTFKGIGTGLIVAGAVGLIFRKETMEGIVAIFIGWLILFSGFFYTLKKEEINE